MLNDIELATLAYKLQTPMVISDILDGKETYDGDAKYALHEAISEMKPDSALLAICLSALKIANIYRNASSSMDVMSIEATRIINEYGAIWVKNANNQDLDGDEVFDTLIHTTEDLETMAELLDLNCSFLRAKDSQAASICDVLFTQAHSHAMIADAFINAADQMVVNGTVPNIQAQRSGYSDNVIQFPGASV
ncbi:MAG: hypothetical protein KDJ35_05260 [Alphaproteobacteria bacterium]|nr:hypothetical protein [Alphaproteobacteria bacterium]